MNVLRLFYKALKIITWIIIGYIIISVLSKFFPFMYNIFNKIYDSIYNFIKSFIA